MLLKDYLKITNNHSASSRPHALFNKEKNHKQVPVECTRPSFSLLVCCSVWLSASSRKREEKDFKKKNMKKRKLEA